MVETWKPQFVVGIAEAVTGKRGYEALRLFSKQLAIGATRDAGDEDMSEVFARELTRLYDRVEVLTRLTFANEASRFRWLFDEPWLLDPAAWQERGCEGLVLIGMDGDARLFYVPAEEALSVLQTSGSMFVLTVRVDHADLDRWEVQWHALRGDDREVRS